jgi:myo-inositol 2-dehydrogenase / D-chiro-inositol 1-dehydrogenase
MVGIGIIGLGVMGADHARILAETRGVTLEVLCDADAGRVKTIADETGARNTTANPAAVIGDPSVDAVLIASPDATHKDLTIACLAAGKPVLCEKPLAPTSAECLEVLDAETRLGSRLVHVGYMRRFDPSYVEMKAKLLSGNLGKALMLHCIHRNVSAPDWFDSRMAISNSAVHEFDIARWLLDDELTSVHVHRPGSGGGASPGAPVFLVLETAKGQLVDIEVFVDAAYGYDVRGELVCEQGSVSLHAPLRTETSAALSHGTEYPADWRPRFADAYRLQARSWIRAIEAGGDPGGASAWDGYAASAVAEAALQSLASGQRAPIELVQKPGMYQTELA